ncbi:hypothetical protein EJB05_50147, partial [Eragrostis curvula]
MMIRFKEMADNEKEVVEGTTAPRGADWEVVTLTASAYEAAPGPEGRPTAGTRGIAASNSSDPLLMSDHFVFPPSEHENLPIQTSFEEVQPEKDVQAASTSVEDYSFKNVGAKNDSGSESIEFFDEGRNLSADDIEMRDDAPEYGSAHAEDGGRGFVPHDEGTEAGGDSGEQLDQPSKSADSKSDDAGASCKCWLKKHMTCLYHQAKETNAIWSVVVAAAIVGIVIFGRYKDKLHINPLKWCSGSAVRNSTVELIHSRFIVQKIYQS